MSCWMLGGCSNFLLLIYYFQNQNSCNKVYGDACSCSVAQNSGGCSFSVTNPFFHLSSWNYKDMLGTGNWEHSPKLLNIDWTILCITTGFRVTEKRRGRHLTGNSPQKSSFSQNDRVKRRRWINSGIFAYSDCLSYHLQVRPDGYVKWWIWTVMFEEPLKAIVLFLRILFCLLFLHNMKCTQVHIH